MPRIHSHSNHSDASRMRGVAERYGQDPYESLNNIARRIGNCVYHIRTHEGAIKIGYTSDLHRRLQSYGVQWDYLLAVKPGSREDEAAALRLWDHLLMRGKEWFYPGADLVAHINSTRRAMGIPAIPMLEDGTPWPVLGKPMGIENVPKRHPVSPKKRTLTGRELLLLKMYGEGNIPNLGQFTKGR